MAKTDAALTPEAVQQQRDLAPAKSETTPRPSLVEATPLSVVDEFHGQGGTYLLDPATGIRTLVERTEPAPL